MSENIDLNPSVPTPELIVPNLASENVPNYTIPEARPKKFPFLAFLLLLFLAAATSISIYLLFQVRAMTQANLPPSPTPTSTPIASVDPTTDWEIYDNNVFSFSHDNTYKVKDMPVMNENPEYSIGLERDGSNIALFNIYRKNALYKTNDSPKHDLTLDEWVDWNLYKNCIDKTLNLLSGKYCTSNPYSDNEYIFVAKINDRFIEAIGKSDNQKIIDEILSTFKFIEKSKKGDSCAGPNNLLCGEKLVCKLTIPNDISKGGICVNEAETNP